MEINKIIKDQLKASHRENCFIENNEIGVRIIDSAKITIDDKNVIRLKFEPIDGIGLKYVSAFFRNRISSRDLEFWIMENGITLRYRGTVSPKVNKFKVAMDIYMAFDNLYSQYIIFNRLVLSSSAQ